MLGDSRQTLTRLLLTHVPWPMIFLHYPKHVKKRGGIKWRLLTSRWLMHHELSIAHEECFGYLKVCDFTSICCFFISCRPKKKQKAKISESSKFHRYLFLNSHLVFFYFHPQFYFCFLFWQEIDFFHFPPTSYYRALLLSFFMSQNCSSVSLSNFPYPSEKPSADLCHLYGDTYQSAAAALTTHSAVYKIIMDLVRCGNIQFFSAVNLCNTEQKPDEKGMALHMLHLLNINKSENRCISIYTTFLGLYLMYWKDE